MDKTSLFKACVKTVKTRNKALGVGPTENDKNRILPSAKTKSELTIRAKEVINYISKLRDFLLEHRKDYINVSSLGSGLSRLTDSDRDQIDNDAQNFIRQCSQNLKEFKVHMSKKSCSPQLAKHRDAVFELIEVYLKAVCKIYSEQRAIRVKRAVDIQRFSRLETDQKSRKWAESIDSSPSNDLADGELIKVQENKIIEDKQPVLNEDDELSPEEMQMFEQENQRLYEELNSLASEVRQIEGRVVEISRLQEIFAEKVLEQERDIDRVADTVVGTTENIKDANEELREAMKKNAGFRVWILFFLIVLSFSLLFLDWYNN